MSVCPTIHSCSPSDRRRVAVLVCVQCRVYLAGVVAVPRMVAQRSSTHLGDLGQWVGPSLFPFFLGLSGGGEWGSVRTAQCGKASWWLRWPWLVRGELCAAHEPWWSDVVPSTRIPAVCRRRLQQNGVLLVFICVSLLDAYIINFVDYYTALFNGENRVGSN